MNVLRQYRVLQAIPAAAEQCDQIYLDFRVAVEMRYWGAPTH